MSLTTEKGEEPPKKPVIPRETQDDLVHVIQMSLKNIATEVNNLNKYAEDLFGGLSQEANRMSFRLKVLQERVIQVTDGISDKNRNERLSLQMMKSGHFQSTFQIEQIYSSKQSPVKMFETHDAREQTLLLNRTTPSCQGDRDLKFFPDASYGNELFQEKMVPESQEEMRIKFKQKRRDHPNKPESGPQSQPMGDGVSASRGPAAGTEVSRSDVDQPDASPSFSSLQLCDLDETVTRVGGRVFPGSPHRPTRVAGEVKDSLTYVNYGTGVGEEWQPPPRNRLRTEVFVSPTAPDCPPLLPTDWLALLRASKTETPSRITRPPTQAPCPVLRSRGATPPRSRLPPVPEAAVLVIPPEGDCSARAPEPSPSCGPTADDPLSHGDDRGVPPPASPSPGPSLRAQTRPTVPDLSVSASVVRPPISSVFPPPGSSLVQSPAPAAAKAVPSIPSSPTSAPSAPESSWVPPPRSTTTPLPRPPTSQTSAPRSSATSCPQTSATSSLRHSLDQLGSSVAALTSCLEEQPPRPPAAPSGRPSVAPSSRRHELPPQPRPSSPKPPRPFTLQSLLSLVQSPSCPSSPGTPSRAAGVNAASERFPSPVPVITRAREVLIEAVRGVLLHKN